MSDPVYYPFGPVPSSSNPNVFPYDIVIEENFPGLVFQPTEPSGVYSVIREVNGCLWFVNNADWNPNTGLWTQEDPTNANLPAYALELCGDGTFTRYAATATLVPGTAVGWIRIFEIDANGQVISTPLTVAIPSQAQQQIFVTWNAGSATQVQARLVQVTDNSSSASSALDNLVVNGVSKWLVDKAGVLQAGSIPFARITGFSPVFNNATFTGTSTFNGPVHDNNGLTVAGGETVDTINVTSSATINNPTLTGTVTIPGGGQLGDAPAFTTTSFTYPALNSSITIPITSSHGYPIGATVIVSGSGTSGSENFIGTITNNNGMPSTSITVQNHQNIFGSPGDTVNSGAVVSFSCFQPNITSPDNSIIVAGTSIAPTLEVGSPFPPVTTSSFSIPAIGSNVTFSYRTNDGFPQFGYVIIANDTGNGQFLGKVVSNSQSGGICTTTVTNLGVYLGAVGASMPAGHVFLFSAGYDPSIISIGQTFAKATNFAIGATTGTLAFSTPLIGTSSNTYLVICSGSLQFQNSSRQLTLTGSGTGTTWPNSPQIYQNANAGTFPFTFYGTAVGGALPSVTWTCNDVLFAEPMTMVLVAYVQS